MKIDKLGNKVKWLTYHRRGLRFNAYSKNSFGGRVRFGYPVVETLKSLIYHHSEQGISFPVYDRAKQPPTS